MKHSVLVSVSVQAVPVRWRAGLFRDVDNAKRGLKNAGSDFCFFISRGKCALENDFVFLRRIWDACRLGFRPMAAKAFRPEKKTTF